MVRGPMSALILKTQPDPSVTAVQFVVVAGHAMNEVTPYFVHSRTNFLGEVPPVDVTRTSTGVQAGRSALGAGLSIVIDSGGVSAAPTGATLMVITMRRAATLSRLRARFFIFSTPLVA